MTERNGKYHYDPSNVKGILYDGGIPPEAMMNHITGAYTGPKGTGKKMFPEESRTVPFGLVDVTCEERFGPREVHLRRKNDLATGDKITGHTLSPGDTVFNPTSQLPHVRNIMDREAPYGKFDIAINERFGDKEYVPKKKGGEVAAKVNSGLFDPNIYAQRRLEKDSHDNAGAKQRAGSGIFGGA